MTHGANMAFVELSERGTSSSGSVMVPCPWFPEAAEIARTYPALDLGVHLTLTSEQKPYRWRPLTAPSKSAGLTDALGYFWPDVPTARKAAPDVVEAELRAQLKTAFSAGIDVTHLDAHMGTAQMPEFVDIFRRLGREYRLPVLLVKDLSRYNPASYAGPVNTAGYAEAIAAARADGDPIFDIVFETPWARKTKAEIAYRAIFAEISEGLTFLSMHFNAPGPTSYTVDHVTFQYNDFGWMNYASGAGPNKITNSNFMDTQYDIEMTAGGPVTLTGNYFAPKVNATVTRTVLLQANATRSGDVAGFITAAKPR